MYEMHYSTKVGSECLANMASKDRLHIELHMKSSKNVGKGAKNGGISMHFCIR